MDPLAEKILKIKEKKLAIEKAKKEEEENARRRKQLILEQRSQEFYKLINYLKDRIDKINQDLNSEDIKYEENDKLFKILYEGFYITFSFDFIYSHQPEGTQIIVSIGKTLGLDDPTISSYVYEGYYWLPKVPDDKILWTMCNNYHIEGEIKNISIEEVGNYSLEKFINLQLNN